MNPTTRRPSPPSGNPAKVGATAEDVASLRAWVDRFSGHVANLRYEEAAAMMDPEVNSFSTWTDIVVGVNHFVNSQWRNVWPTMTGFRLLTEAMRCRVSGDRLMAAVMVTWESTGYTQEGEPFNRPGRCSFVLTRDTTADSWRGVQGHFSLMRGVPQQSFGPPDGRS